MTIHTLTTEQLMEGLEKAFDEGYRCAGSVAEQGDPMDVFRTEGYIHARCQQVERLLFWLGGKR